ncbi:MAG: hypothetical protein WDA22_07920 [Bacteroidota bacterium]
MKKIFSLILIFAFLVVLDRSFAQSGSQYYRSAVHNANRVKTVFGNWGVIGQPTDTRPRGSWIFSANGYIGDVSLIVGAEVKTGATKFHSVVTSPVSRPASTFDTDDKSGGGKHWTFMPVSGYFNPAKQSIAMSDDQSTWPTSWPDKLNDALDPGWQGSWNGYFGKRASANQESYVVMDDNNDVRFNFAANNTDGIAFKPDSTNLLRNGLGLTVKVRGLQWSQFLAQDNIFWLYEITNTSTTNYDRATFGMLVGTLVGVTGSQNFNEYDDDWSFYDVNENINYTGDFDRNCSRNPFWQGSVGMVGYAFLESPGNPFDGIDNDGDVDKKVIGSPTALYVATDFDSTLINTGDKVVLIANDFSRQVVTVGSTPITYTTRGGTVSVTPGVTRLAEGNVITVSNLPVINPNAYDGIDNDLDGVIDENVYLHYRQVKLSDDTPPKTLIDILRPLRHIAYNPVFNGGPFSMIDERRDDFQDNDKDWNINFDDVGLDGVANSKDAGESDGLPTSGYMASGFDTGLPGEPNMDKTDVDESDQIGLTGFFYFTPANNVPLGDDELMWGNMQPGFFSVPKSIVNNKPEYGQDGDFIYASGFFPLIAKRTERFSLALVYGGGIGGSREDDIKDLLKHKQTVQKIYDANYQFPIAPEPVPTLTAVAGDGNVKLYWDRRAENAIDPVLRIKDFQGYKIYKATDFEFNDAFSVTDAEGNRKGYDPAFQFDLKDTISGFYRAPEAIFDDAAGFTYKLGSNTGLVHDTTDSDVINGKTYYYVIVAYDNGDEVTGIFPSENGWKIDIDQAGRIRGTSQNVAIVVPGKKVVGYTPPASFVKLPKSASVLGSGNMYYNVIDESKINGSTYEISFNDTRDSGKISPVTTLYSVKDSAYYTATFTPSKIDTITALLPKQQIAKGSVTISRLDGTVVDTSKYIINYDRGAIRAKARYDLQPDTNNLRKYTIRYQYYPIHESPYMNGSPYVKETEDTDIFDGIQLAFNNIWNVGKIDSLSKFNTGLRAYDFDFSTNQFDINVDGKDEIPTRFASDYVLTFGNTNIDSTSGVFEPFIPKMAIPFTVKNLTTNKRVEVLWEDGKFFGQLSSGDFLYFFERSDKDSLFYSWVITFKAAGWLPPGKDSVFTFGNGDSLTIRTTKPFRKGDTFVFSTSKPKVLKANIPASLSTLRVVPNPYVVQATGETPPAAGTFGRGERKIEFQNVPQDAKVSIYTARGEHIRTLYQDGSIQNGTIKWDVKTKENLDVAFGVYFYVVESSAGTKSGKIAVIK